MSAPNPEGAVVSLLEDSHNCVTCKRPDSAQAMVACDQCSLWQHYSCAGVDASVENHSWICGSCAAANRAVDLDRDAPENSSETTTVRPNESVMLVVEPKRVSAIANPAVHSAKQLINKPGAGSIISLGTNARLRLKQLEEQKLLEDRIREEKAERERMFLAKKHELEAEIAQDESRGGSECSFGNRSVRNVTHWVNQQREHVHSSTPIQHNAAVPTGQQVLPNTEAQLPSVFERNPPPAQAQGTKGNPHFAAQGLPPASQNLVPPVSGIPVHPTAMFQPANAGLSFPQGPIFCANNAAYPALGPGYMYPYNQGQPQLPPSMNYPVGGQYPPSSTLNPSHLPHRGQQYSWPATEQQPPASARNPTNDQQNFPHTGAVSSINRTITAQQLAVRQVISKDLPQFSGDPLEWPMFIAAFESTTTMCGIQPAENLARLQKSLVGSARERVLSILTIPDAIPEIISVLRDECGRPDLLIHCLLTRIRKTAQPNINKLDTLVAFGREVRNLVTYMQSAKLHFYLADPLLLAELVSKLPSDLLLQWGHKLADIQEPTLTDFSSFISSLRTAACRVTMPKELGSSDRYAKGTAKKEKAGFLNIHSSNDRPSFREEPVKVRSEPKPCLMCKSNGHKIKDCRKFEELSLEEKYKFIAAKGMCKRCLFPHGKWPCRTKQPCGINSCTEAHHKLLHPVSENSSNSREQSGPTYSVAAHRNHRNHGATLFKILPVVLHGNGKSVTTFAFLDDGSDLTLVEDHLIDQLGLTGETSTLCLQWTSQVTRKENASRRVDIGISGVGNDNIFQMSNVRSVSNLDLPMQSLNYDELKQRYTHLNGLPISSYQSATPRILIGIDNAKLNLALKKRERGDGEPIGAKFRLGWTIFGGRRLFETSGSISVHTCECSGIAKVHDLVQQYFEADNMLLSGINIPESEEDQRARRILETTTIRTSSGKFQTGLLWKSDCSIFPDNYAMAVRRHGCFERRLLKDPELKAKVDHQIAEYLRNGYIHKATFDELCNADKTKVWYLPITVVRNPRKPAKIRVVWDAAASSGGISLNSQLLKGPDLLTPLLSVLSKFRQKQFAIAGDIRQMFHQLIIRPDDRHVQRFLYRTDPKGKLDTYVMDVATFGATCSPCSAQFCKNKNAWEHKEKYPDAAAAIVSNTYVDDFLDSRDTADESAKLALEVTLVNKAAGFDIPSWQSNSDYVLKRVGVTGTADVKNFTIEKTTIAERVLGMMWAPCDDVFLFSANFRPDLHPLLSGEIRPSKRQVLQVVMSLFDPLGIVACFTIHGKILIQSVWRSGVQWDDPICDEEYGMWQRWIRLAPNLDKVKIPRCYFPGYRPSSYESLQLHVFVDASELAYCAVAYFRILDDDIPRCALVAAKTKVTPLRPQSIPRNELCSAVLGSRLMKSIVEYHSLKICRKFLWTDSLTVMAWLRADPRKYRQFVGFRVAEILALTAVDDWYWVPSILNIADQGTKWGDGPSFEPDRLWYNGPEFLLLPSEEWPKRKQPSEAPADELRTVHVHRLKTEYCKTYISKFSQWDQLIKKLAYLYHFVHRSRTKNRTDTDLKFVVLNQADYVAAEAALWRVVQQEEFSEEIATLKKNSKSPSQKWKHVAKRSPLSKLSPFFDEFNVLRSMSRIDPEASYYSFNFRNPVIVPKDHPATNLLILRYHQKYGHANTETVLNELKQQYYIPRMRATVKKAIKSCMWCRVYRAKPCAPKMAPLPQPRVKPYVRPFSFTGLDYFGPLLVKRGRCNEKRWVALFTCLSIRALHLEVVHTMSADSCKMAIRRFIAKHGPPQELYCDNGTNFRGASRELAEEAKEINKQLAKCFTNNHTAWNFNPPSAPHMGGVWERKVRSVKEAFKTLSHNQKLDDEALKTLLSEAEMIVNSHPLTFVPLENPEDEVLTPNNFLWLTSGEDSRPPRVPTDDAISLRSNWKLVQHLVNQFWKRWIQAYLPTIACRTKWFEQTRPMEVGDLVVIVDESVRNGWLRGRIVKSYPGRDGEVHKVDVKTCDGSILQRPTVKVALLDVQENSKIE